MRVLSPTGLDIALKFNVFCEDRERSARAEQSDDKTSLGTGATAGHKFGHELDTEVDVNSHPKVYHHPYLPNQWTGRMKDNERTREMISVANTQLLQWLNGFKIGDFVRCI